MCSGQIHHTSRTKCSLQFSHQSTNFVSSDAFCFLFDLFEPNSIVRARISIALLFSVLKNLSYSLFLSFFFFSHSIYFCYLLLSCSLSKFVFTHLPFCLLFCHVDVLWFQEDRTEDAQKMANGNKVKDIKVK